MLRLGSVLCKIFSASPTEVESICLATNSQTRINIWDLRTNDKIQKTIESFLNINGILYNRKAKSIGRNGLTFVELGQWLYTCFELVPSQAKNKKRSIFDPRQRADAYYNTVFNEQRSLDSILTIVKDGIFIRDFISRLRVKEFEKHADLHFLAGFYLLRHKKWQRRTKFNRIRGLLRLTIDHVRNNIDPEMTYVSMFAKRVDAWNDLEPRIRAL